MSHWHYQLMKHPDGSYAIHEMYHMDDGDGWTENPITVIGESVEDVKKSLLMMLDDIDRHGVGYQVVNRQVEIEETVAGRYEMSNPGDKDYEV